MKIFHTSGPTEKRYALAVEIKANRPTIADQ
jgi:hypothetical protein